MGSATLTYGVQSLKGFPYVPLHANLRRENVPDNPLLVYYVGNPTSKETEGVRNTIEPSDLTPLVAE